MSKTVKRIPSKQIKRSGAGMHIPKTKKPPRRRIDWLAQEMDYSGEP